MVFDRFSLIQLARGFWELSECGLWSYSVFFSRRLLVCVKIFQSSAKHSKEAGKTVCCIQATILEHWAWLICENNISFGITKDSEKLENFFVTMQNSADCPI